MTEVTRSAGRTYLKGYCLMVSRFAGRDNRFGLGTMVVTPEEFQGVSELEQGTLDRLSREIDTREARPHG